MTERIEAIEIYRAQVARIVNLNSSLYQIPPIFSTIIGGLWYFASTQIASHRLLAVVAFLFAGAVGLAGGNSVWRLRLAMNGYYNQIEIFEREYHVTTTSSRLPSMVRAVLYMLLFSAFLSAFGAVYAFMV